jgi:hypothetical protein
MSQRSPLGSIMAKQWMTFAATRNPNTDGGELRLACMSLRTCSLRPSQ